MTARGYDQTIKHNGTYAEWIKPNQVKPFQIMYERLCEKLGGTNAFKKELGMGNKTIDDLKNGRLSEPSAKRIMKKYKEVFKC